MSSERTVEICGGLAYTADLIRILLEIRLDRNVVNLSKTPKKNGNVGSA